ncbi:hypothetical protein [Aquidulcibacter sp.]|uniref:hypothetical protein n=1 Tax=Aquidulcibacter sp. TaxID=2052990 RepID=UPI0028B00F2D|nr:hypothetical protein [Aquidulcibacter sp.]
MNAALLTVLMAAAGTALLAFVGFRLGLSVDRRIKDNSEVVKAVQAHSGLQAEFDVLISHNQRSAVACGTDKMGYVVTVLGDKLLVRSLDQAKIMVIAEDRLHISFPDFGFEPVYIQANANEIQQALASLGRGTST